jgi:hypothetical protein
MASGYMYDKALGFTTEYLALYPHTRNRIWDVDKEKADVGELQSLNGVVKMLSSLEMEIIHEYVTSNYVPTEAFYKYH